MAARDIEIRHLRYFLAVADERNFTRAATRLGIQQPPLSQQIKTLEEMLGYCLFERNSRGVELTKAGKAFEPFAVRCLATLNEGRHTGHLAETGILGTLTIGFSASLLSAKLASAIRSYRNRHHKVRIVLKEMTTDIQLEALRRSEIDIGLGREARGDGEIVAEHVIDEPLYAFLPKDHFLASRRTVSPQALASDPFVLFPREVGRAFHQRILGVCAEYGFTPTVTQEAVEWYTILRLVATGMGITIGPQSILPMCDSTIAPVRLRPAKYTSVVLLRRKFLDDSLASTFIQEIYTELKLTNPSGRPAGQVASSRSS